MSAGQGFPKAVRHVLPFLTAFPETQSEKPRGSGQSPENLNAQKCQVLGVFCKLHSNYPLLHGKKCACHGGLVLSTQRMTGN